MQQKSPIVSAAVTPAVLDNIDAEVTRRKADPLRIRASRSEIVRELLTREFGQGRIAPGGELWVKP